MIKKTGGRKSRWTVPLSKNYLNKGNLTHIKNSFLAKIATKKNLAICFLYLGQGYFTTYILRSIIEEQHGKALLKLSKATWGRFKVFIDYTTQTNTVN